MSAAVRRPHTMQTDPLTGKPLVASGTGGGGQSLPVSLPVAAPLALQKTMDHPLGLGGATGPTVTAISTASAPPAAHSSRSVLSTQPQSTSLLHSVPYPQQPLITRAPSAPGTNFFAPPQTPLTTAPPALAPLPAPVRPLFVAACSRVVLRSDYN